MSIRYEEFYNGQTGLTVGVEEILFSEVSNYQHVEVFKTDTWGNLMTIDGMVMLSEKDEFVYHEMITHPALCVHPDPKRVLIIGGGDGGTAREVLKHSTVEQVDMVEIDETVVKASKLHFPKVGDWDNPRLHLVFDDGVTFVKNHKNAYDVIIVDGSDPVGPAEGLFNKSFFQNCHQALTENGILTAQSETPWVEKYHPNISDIISFTEEIFALSKLYLAFIPLYPSGMWGLTFASKGIDPVSEHYLSKVDERISRLNGLRYYNREIHQAAFALPNFVKNIIT